MMGVAYRRDAVAASLIVLLAACSGDGSDIGPRLARLPEASSKVQLLDDQNRGVVSGTVTVVGTQLQTLTGRNGRGDFLAVPTGRVVVRADGLYGSANDFDRLGVLQVAMTLNRVDLPAPIHLPNLPDSASRELAAGLQVDTTAITSAAGTVVTVSSGTLIGSIDESLVTIRVGDLSPEHLPGDLPLTGSQANLFGRGIYVYPPEATFSPGLDIDVFDDLSLGANAANLYHLDTETGEWSSVPFALGVASGDRIAAAGVLTQGGLYAFGSGVSDVTVSGRVVDADDPARSVANAMVRVDHRLGLTSSNGRFSVDFVPATLADGTPRSAVVELFAGGSWLPMVAREVVPLGVSPVDVGDIVLDTVLAGDVRVQQVVRAKADVFQPARFSSVDGEVALRKTSDALGQATFEDVPAGYFGFQEGRRRSFRQVYYGQALGFLETGRRRLDSYQFLSDRPWYLGSRSTRGYFCDSIGGGPIRDVSVIQGTEPLRGFIDYTRRDGFVVRERGFRLLATGTISTARDGQSITHAISYYDSYGDHLEFPLRRVHRTPLGKFDRYGLIAGSLTGASASSSQSIRATRRFTKQEWWDDIVDGVPVQTSLPIDAAPVAPNFAFQVGMDAVGGHLAAIEFAPTASGNSLLRAGVLADYQPVEGGLEQRDVPLDLVADQTFSVVGATVGVAPNVDLTTLDVSLALVKAGSGSLVDVARDIGGSYTATVNNLDLNLPALADGDEWLALVRGEKVTGGFTDSHASLIPIVEATTEGFTFPEFPALTAPANGDSVSATGFTTDFILPSQAIGGVIELRSTGPDDLLLWQTIVRPEYRSFNFLELPVQADTPLVAGRTYKLTVTAWFGTIDINSNDIFRDFSPFQQTVGIIESGITQISRRSITITTL